MIDRTIRRAESSPSRGAEPQWLHDGKPATPSMIDGALHPVGVRAVTLDVFQPRPGNACWLWLGTDCCQLKACGAQASAHRKCRSPGCSN